MNNPKSTQSNPSASHVLRHEYDAKYYAQFGQDAIDGRSLPRHSMYTEKYKALDAVPLHPADVVMDVGCGRGDAVVFLAHRCACVYGYDYSEDAIAIAQQLRSSFAPVVQQKIHLGVATADQIPLPDRLLDTVYFLDVIEHLSYEEQKRALAEIYRVLKPGGRCVALTPIAGMPHWLARAWWKLFHPEKLERAKRHLYHDEREPLHIGMLGPREMKSLLRAAGFSVELRFVTSHAQDMDTSSSAVKKWLRYRLLLPLFATKMIAIAVKA